MSLDLYWTRLVWGGGRGVAKKDGRLVQIVDAPRIAGAEVEGLDFAPEVECYQILPQRGGWREMSTTEISECWQLLERLTRPAP